jgi:hypothetical protein
MKMPLRSRFEVFMGIWEWEFRPKQPVYEKSQSSQKTAVPRFPDSQDIYIFLK